MSVIGISGKLQSGKNTVATIIQGLNMSIDHDMLLHQIKLNKPFDKSCGFEQKCFADKLKDIVCLLIGCTREQLEDQTFKNTPLGEEWWMWKVEGYGGEITLHPTKQDGLEAWGGYYSPQLFKLTPRLLLQLIGTECGRQIIHPNIWINATFADYKGVYKGLPSLYEPGKDLTYPNWVITDCRFPNEAKAIKERRGIVIRVNRTYYSPDGKYIMGIDPPKEHESETALDNYEEFDYIIENDSDITSLIEKVKEILIKEKIICQTKN